MDVPAITKLTDSLEQVWRITYEAEVDVKCSNKGTPYLQNIEFRIIGETLDAQK